MTKQKLFSLSVFFTVLCTMLLMNQNVKAQFSPSFEKSDSVENKVVFSEDTSHSCASSLDSISVDKHERDFLYRKSKVAFEPQQGVASGVINVYFHVINDGDGIENGNVSDQQILDQMQVLNTSFAQAGWVFNLVSVDRTTDSDMFNNCIARRTEARMKTALRQGGAEDLNIYTCKTGGPTLGSSTFPADYKRNPVSDGVMILNSSVPGGTTENYNLGITAVHEVGHWMGLYHTFEGGCTSRGDGVSDTPSQRYASWGCPTGNDTCPTSDGFDAVENLMDSSFDSCKYSFTVGQAQRMNDQFAVYRLGK